MYMSYGSTPCALSSGDLVYHIYLSCLISHNYLEYSGILRASPPKNSFHLFCIAHCGSRGCASLVLPIFHDQYSGIWLSLRRNPIHYHQCLSLSKSSVSIVFGVLFHFTAIQLGTPKSQTSNDCAFHCHAGKTTLKLYRMLHLSCIFSYCMHAPLPHQHSQYSQYSGLIRPGPVNACEKKHKEGLGEILLRTHVACAPRATFVASTPRLAWFLPPPQMAPKKSKPIGHRFCINPQT